MYEKVVQKLQLKTDYHPKPYKLSWLTKDSEVKVYKRCLVSFSVGSKYFDNAWCDVVAMDVCHLLLGRPWQYDRSVLHDGRKNTYSLSIKRKNIILAPRREGVSPSPVACHVNLFYLPKFLAADEPILPTEVQQLLEECMDFMPEELPPGLPPENFNLQKLLTRDRYSTVELKE